MVAVGGDAGRADSPRRSGRSNDWTALAWPRPARPRTGGASSLRRFLAAARPYACVFLLIFICVQSDQAHPLYPVRPGAARTDNEIARDANLLTPGYGPAEGKKRDGLIRVPMTPGSTWHFHAGSVERTNRPPIQESDRPLERMGHNS